MTMMATSLHSREWPITFILKGFLLFMDYNKLADLLFPGVSGDIQKYLDKYPKRNLKEGAEVVRIAPSPTGFLHIGSVYGAFIDKLMAYHTGGVFYMRLEDTDDKREVANAGEIAYSMLGKFFLTPDEGYAGDGRPEVGNYGPYVQSKRKDIYLSFAKYLTQKGLAFPCFCKGAEGKAEILKRREEELSQTDDIEGKDPCRNLTIEKIEQNIKAGKPFALRLLSKGTGERTIKFKDRIKGEREIRENSKDIVILKSNLIPPYSFAHVVDDTLMGTTTVVRGEEWYPSLSSHLELFNAFGFKPPKFAHTPNVCKIDESGNKRKLSKRKDPEADARYFIEQGYPIESVLEYLLGLINSNFEDWRKLNKDKSIWEFPFAVSKIGSNNPIFDFVKLGDCSKQVISRFSAERIYEDTLCWAKTYSPDFAKVLSSQKEMCLSLFTIDRTGNNPRKDISKWSDVEGLYDYMFYSIDAKPLKDFDFDERFDKQTIKQVLTEYLKVYSPSDDKQVWFDKIKEVGDKLGFCSNMKEYKLNSDAYKGSVADVSGIIRVATTTRRNTPDLYFLLQLLGKDEVNNRLNRVITSL